MIEKKPKSDRIQREAVAFLEGKFERGDKRDREGALISILALAELGSQAALGALRALQPVR